MNRRLLFFGESIRLKQMMTVISLSLCFAFFISASSQGTEVKAGGKRFKVGVFFNSGSGASASQAYDLAKTILKIYALDEGYNVELVKYPSWDEITKDFIDNKLDAAYLWPHFVVEINDAGGEVIPLLTFTVMKRRKMGFCFWHRKSLVMESPKDIVGKKFIYSTPNVHYFIQMRDYLYKNGVDMPLWKVPASIINAPSSNSANMALAMGDADVYWGLDDADAYMNLISPAVAKDLTHQFCSERVYARANIILNKKSFTKQDVDVITARMNDLLGNFTKYSKEIPELQGMRQYLKMAKMTIIPASPDEFDYDIKLFKKAKKNGWYQEAVFMYERLKDAKPGTPVDLKPDYAMCKTLCADKKADEQTTCVYSCME